MKVAGFEWDAGNWPKCAKHGVTKDEIEEVLTTVRYVVDDPTPGEKRLRTFGKASTGRYVFVVFTHRERPAGVLIRPISARYMHRREVAAYEEAMAKLEQR